MMIDLDDAQAAIKLDFKSTKHFWINNKYLFLKFVTFYTWLLNFNSQGKVKLFCFTDFTKKSQFYTPKQLIVIYTI
jgi:hypothetical protein